MVTEFAVFGSCTCRDIFNSNINNNYKDYFHINPSGIRLSYISIMQEPINYKKNSLKIYPETTENINFSNWIKQDLDKSFLNDLKKNKPEYLIIDTYYDTNLGIIDLGNETYITNNLHIDETEFYESLNYKKIMTIHTNTSEYLKLWEKNCKLFFNFLKENCKNTNIILNPTRHVTNLIRKSGKVAEIDLYKKISEKYNPYRDLFDKYIIENFDIDVLYFNENTLANENSIWGASSLHYDSAYFIDVTKQLNEFIKRNTILNNTNENKLNNKFKQQNKDILSYKIQLKNYNKYNILKHKFLLTKKYKSLIQLNRQLNNNIIQLNQNKIITPDEYQFLTNINSNKLSQIQELNKMNK